jgi:uncharacterized protein (TIGR02147 family)
MSLRGIKSVYSYSDYQSYLRDYFSVRKSTDPSYSHRTMSRELGFPSPNHIKMVMDGKRRIGLRSLNRLLEGLGLRDREKEYFSYLVFFCQARTSIVKNYYFGLLTGFRTPMTVKTITSNEYEYYNNWYNCVVRELIVREKSPIDYDCLARKIRPRISPAQAKKSVALLLELGMITRKNDGTYEQTSHFIGTEREVTSIGIRNHHAKMFELARDAMDTVPRDLREMSSLTVSISDSCRQKIKQRVQEFEDEIIQMVQNDRDVQSVYQVNFQFFPLTQDVR